ncbi:MAG: tRNA (adenosine(37)-N6)-threonylcarbamoyltransferase complex dimerization subunit type 1 TsaB [Anaerolineaceae bacterium]|nr:tRNA (adenosine(37)-N6)-threonylcarbamoyltransferase complex dimerization subunit type 1 TsaB [Anaerolineaceae bacterium]
MLLAVDTSTRWIGMAFYDGIQIKGEVIWKTNNHHTVELAPALDQLFTRCAITSADLKVLAVALGPGSFTSLRIGLALVKGMALALHLPVIGVPSLDVLAAAQPVQDMPLAAVLQAGRGRLALVYYRLHRGKWKADSQPEVVTTSTLAGLFEEPTMVCGEMTADDRHTLSENPNAILMSPAASLRRPSYLAALAWKRYQSRKFDEVASLSPIYLHLNTGTPV